MKLFLVFLLVFKIYIVAEPLSLSDIGKSATDVAKGVIEKIPDAIPKPEDIFQAGKNLIAGYPFQQVNNSFLFTYFRSCFCFFNLKFTHFTGVFCYQYIL